MANDAFDLFATLGRISKGDTQWYEKLSDDAKKGVAPFVLMRWLSGTSDPAQVIALNTFSNPYMFSLGQQKELLCKLLAASCTGRTGRYSWIKAPGSKDAKLARQAIADFYGISQREAKMYDVDAASVIEMAEQLGWDSDQLKKLTSEVDGGSGRTKASGSKASKRS